MPEEKILHVYSDHRKADQIETWRALKSIEPVYKVDHVRVLKETDYADTIKRNWNKGHTLILIEQDIVPTSKQIKELLSCRARLCSFPYLVKADIPDSYSIFNFTKNSKPDNWMTYDGSRYIDRVPFTKKVKYCGLSGFGLTKISIKAQKMFDFPRLYQLKRWDIIDSWFSLRLYERIKRNRIFHIHYPPVKHNHYSSPSTKISKEESKLLVF